MRTWKRRSTLAFMMGLAILIVACGPGGSARREAQGGATSEKLAGRDKAQSEAVKIVKVAGLDLKVPESNVMWPTRMTKDSREPKYGGVVNFVHSADPPSMDPSLTTSFYQSRITTYAYERLLHWPTEPGADPYDAKLVPGLAESWEASKDGLSYTFKLRKGVKWANVEPTNGREFTADDVIFTSKYYTRPQSIIKSGLWETVQKIEAPDKYTVVFHLQSPMKDFLPEISSPVVGLIVPREVIERDGDLKKVAVGTGPFYAIEGYRPKVGIDFKRNQDYWMKDERGKQIPYLDGMSLHIVADQSARQAAMRTGKLDWGAEFSTPTEQRTFLKSNPNVYGQENITGYGGQGWAFRHDRKDLPFNDARVRQAMSLAINYKEMAQTISEVPNPELHVSIRGFWTKEGTDTVDNLSKIAPWYSYDPERAKKLMAEAGYPNGFKTAIEFYEYSKADVGRAEMLQDYWKKIGIDAELKSMEYSVFRANVDTAGWQEMGYTFPFPNRMDVDSVLNFVHSKGLGIGTQGKYGDPQVDQWVEKFWASSNETERMDLLKKIRHYTLDQVSIIPLFAAPTFTNMQPWLRDFQPEINAFFPGKDRRNIVHAWIDDGWRK